jgi:hypothetical protein
MKPSFTHTQTPEEKAVTVRQLEPLTYMSLVDGIIESLEFNDPAGYGAYEEELRKQIQEDIEYWKKVKKVLESPKDISYYNSIAY